MNIFLKLLVGTVAVLVAAKIVPGVLLDSPWTALTVAVVLGAANLVIRPLLIVLTLPITLVTLGLFLFVVNALIVLLAAWLVPGFHVAGLWSAMLFSIVIALTGWFLDALGERN